MSSLPPLSTAPASRRQGSDPKASSPDGHSSGSSASSSSPGSGPSSSSLSPPSSSNQSPNDGDDDDTKAALLVRWTKKPRRKRTGWGPYQSVLNERSVDFNLTLDVQNLKQEIQHMQTYYDLLASKMLIQRHDPSGSLVRIAQEHYRIFRTGFNLRQTGRKRLMDEKDQKEFLHSIFDDEVECGVGADGEIQRGIGVMVQQIMLYTVFIKAIAMTLTSFEVILVDDTVIVATKGILHFQILRNTIAGMFPHVLGEEWLMSKLVGQEVAPETAMNFYFNKQNKVTKFAVELDYVKTFAGVLSSPEEVDVLLGRALISEDCLILPSNEEEDKAPPPMTSPSGSNSPKDSSDAGSGNGSGVDGDAEDLSATSSGSSAKDSDHSRGGKPSSTTTQAVRTSPSVQQGETASASMKRPGSTSKSTARAKPSPARSSAGSQSERASSSPPAIAPAVCRGPMTPVDHFNSVVQLYFRLFAQGCHASTEASAAEFLTKYFSTTVEYGNAVGRQVLHDRWRSLSWCFDVLSFRQVIQGGQTPPVAVYEPQQNRYRIETRAEYALQLTVRTLELVFPHVVSDLALTDLLVGSRIVVSSDLSFWLERGTGLLAKVSERMAFEDAFKQAVEDPEDLAFVLQGAQPILTSFVGRITSVASPSQEGQLKARATGDESESDGSLTPSSPNDSQSSETEAKMRLSVILG
ncbi:hypothetical protein Gpo141_00005112 [Globisporangium polare]